MIIGIVGSEESKFTEVGELRAKEYIHRLISDPLVTEVVSGGCHLGGIDIWTEEIAKSLNKKMTVCYPAGLKWEGYKRRNIEIAEKSDFVHCISVDRLPETYKGMKFDLCYHCEKNTIVPYPEHVKSGGCWTMYYAINLGKQGRLFVVHN